MFTAFTADEREALRQVGLTPAAIDLLERAAADYAANPAGEAWRAWTRRAQAAGVTDLPRTPREVQERLDAAADAIDYARHLVSTLPPNDVWPLCLGYALPAGWRVVQAHSGGDEVTVRKGSLSAWREDCHELARMLRHAAAELDSDGRRLKRYAVYEWNTAIGCAVFVATGDLAPADVLAVLEVLEDVNGLSRKAATRLVGEIQRAAAPVRIGGLLKGQQMLMATNRNATIGMVAPALRGKKYVNPPRTA